MALIPKKPTRTLSGGIALVVLCVLAIVIMTVFIREGAGGPLHTARSAVGVVTMPLQQAGSFLSTPFRALGNVLDNSAVTEDEVEQIRTQNEELRGTVMLLEEYRLEADRLSKLLEMTEAYNLDYEGARVISRTNDSWNRTLTIDKGSGNGLQVGMPVMSANGLIGQVESVNLYSSVVRLITDENSGVSVFLQASRTEGIVTGSVEGLLYLQFIPLDVSVIPGDVVVTSGAGGVYPKGIVIGEVASVTSAPNDTYQTIVVRTITRVASYEEVLVLVGNQSDVALPEGQAQAGGAAGTADGAQGAQGSEAAGGTQPAAGDGTGTGAGTNPDAGTTDPAGQDAAGSGG